MCGIAAIAGQEINLNRYKIKDMLQKLRQRGPDNTGEKLFSFCWLGHRRLSIIDLETGNQPMTDGELAITFNGEIYNLIELREQLEKRGHDFKTHSDTEIILKAYRTWGNDCVKHLDGQFAFIVWNDESKEMFFARDRFGKKPLYYFFDGSTIVFASEIKTLLASGVLVPELDYSAIDNYLRLMYIPSWKSVYKNIHQIPPAHCGTYKNNKINIQRYWEILYKPIKISYNEAKEEVYRLLNISIKKRMTTSDVEVGAFLSGGLDSSLIALIAAKELSSPLKVFSVEYNDINELPYAKQVCSKISANHFIAKIDRCSTGELDKIISYFDEPHADTSDFPQHIISQCASQNVKVVLSGDGADELFLGYKWHTQNQSISEKSHSNLFHERLYSISPFPLLERKELWGSREVVNNDILIKDIYNDKYSPIDNVAMFDLTSHLPGQILTKIDRAGMMHGLEVRSPFLDTALAEFAYNLPYVYKIKNREQKYILKDILSEYMPNDFVYRRKQGFGAPINYWLNNPDMKSYVYEQLGAGAKIRSIFSHKSIDKHLNNFYNEKHKHKRAGQRLWVLLCLERWLSQLKINL